MRDARISRRQFLVLAGSVPILFTLPNGRLFAGEGNGVAVSVRTMRKKPVLTLALDVTIAQPLTTPGDGAPLDLTYDVGGLTGRGSGLLRRR